VPQLGHLRRRTGRRESREVQARGWAGDAVLHWRRLLRPLCCCCCCSGCGGMAAHSSPGLCCFRLPPLLLCALWHKRTCMPEPGTGMGRPALILWKKCSSTGL
jgi:hypothetical protein